MSGLFEKCAGSSPENLWKTKENYPCFYLWRNGDRQDILAKAALRDSLEGGGEVLFLNAIKLNKLFLITLRSP
jgi:hypothetical protein